MIRLRPSSDPALLAAAQKIWRQNHCLCPAAICHYRDWVLRFQWYCGVRGIDEYKELTRAGAREFAIWYARRRQISLPHTINGARSALGTWALALRSLGKLVPSWIPKRIVQPASPLLEEFVAYQREVRGNPDRTLRIFLYHIGLFDEFLRKGSVRLQALRLTDIDAFIIVCHERYARKTVAGICSTIRAYLRFLYSTGRLKTDLAASVVSPAIRPLERPHRTLPWKDVRRLLAAVDRRSRCGKRDYAVLLLMSTYGLGAGEVIHLTLDDVDWQAMTLRIVRPKTGVEFMLPMMPAIAEALASYLRHGRPPHCSDRSVFVTMRVPHHRLADVVTLRHILHSAAQRAGISAPFLGTHVFRHTHACRQLELGTPTKIIGDILGHRDPESTSAYLRVATPGLRALALPVPR